MPPYVWAFCNKNATELFDCGSLAIGKFILHLALPVDYQELCKPWLIELCFHKNWLRISFWAISSVQKNPSL